LFREIKAPSIVETHLRLGASIELRISSLEALSRDEIRKSIFIGLVLCLIFIGNTFGYINI